LPGNTRIFWEDIPGASNIPYASLVDGNGKLKTSAELQRCSELPEFILAIPLCLTDISDNRPACFI